MDIFSRLHLDFKYMIAADAKNQAHCRHKKVAAWCRSSIWQSFLKMTSPNEFVEFILVVFLVVNICMFWHIAYLDQQLDEALLELQRFRAPRSHVDVSYDNDDDNDDDDDDDDDEESH